LKSIGVETFEGMSGLNCGLVFPDGLERIERCAFNRCENLVGDLVIPDSVTFIGDYAFAKCGFDGTLTLSKNLKEIQTGTFSTCKNFKGDLVIPEGVKTIAMHAFMDDGFDGTLTLSEGLEYIGIYALSCKNFKGDLVIPDSVTLIDSSAFQSCEGFTSLKLPDSLEYINDNAFMYCKGMTGELNLPSALVVIGDDAFSATGFTGELVLPAGLESIGRGSFGDCKGFTSISEFPESLKHIKRYAFGGCSSIVGELVFPEKMTSVGENAFLDCPLITKVTFGKDMCSIGEGAFKKCEGLKNAVFTGDIPDYYGPEEKEPSFPEGCVVSAPASAVKLSDTWTKKVAETSSGKKTDNDLGEERDVPYYWTQSITGEYFTGAGYFADVTILLDDEILHVSVNGRELMDVPYYADPNADGEDQVVETEGFFCRDGMIKNLKFEQGFNSDRMLIGTLTRDDGATEEVVFHTLSEECLYLSTW
jgi:hypothetical protein